MSLEQDLVAALTPCVPPGRVHRTHFPQTDGPSVWPAIRYTVVDTVPGVDVCGDGGDDDTADVRVQIDVVHTTAAGCAAVRHAVRAAVYAGIRHAVMESSQDGIYDAETKTYRTIMDYMVFL